MKEKAIMKEIEQLKKRMNELSLSLRETVLGDFKGVVDTSDSPSDEMLEIRLLLFAESGKIKGGQTKVAKLLGVDRQRVQNWLSDEKIPRDYLQAIKQAHPWFNDELFLKGNIAEQEEAIQ